jgi:hypothetical protein
MDTYVPLAAITAESSAHHWVAQMHGAPDIKVEEIFIDVLYDKRVDRWFGHGVDVWLRAYFGYDFQVTNGWFELPELEAFSYEHLLGIAPPEFSVHKKMEDDVSNRIRSVIGGRDLLIVGPARWRWLSQPLHCTRVVGSYFRRALEQ